LLISAFETIFSASTQLALLHSIYILPKPFPFIGLHGTTEVSAESYTLTHKRRRKNGIQNTLFLVSFFFASLFLEMELTAKKENTGVEDLPACQIVARSSNEMHFPSREKENEKTVILFSISYHEYLH
jgi:hypothetical protein